MDNGSLLSDLEAQLIQENKEQDRTRGHNFFYPSKATVKLSDGRVIGECLRKLYYEYSDVPQTNPVPIKSLYKMGMGRKIHEWFLGLLEKVKDVAIEKEYVFIDIRLSRPIRGFIDAISPSRIGELKTTWGFGFRKAEFPKPEHILQGRIYKHISNSPDKKLEVIYLARDSANRTSVVVENDVEPEVTYENAVGRWERLEKNLDFEVVPGRDFEKTNWHCQYCSWKDHCWGKDWK